jgi:hypothetical protein
VEGRCEHVAGRCEHVAGRCEHVDEPSGYVRCW